MHILVFGAKGQLGSELVPRINAGGHTCIPMTRQEVDLTDPGAIQARIQEVSPDWVVNCAAYTAVDRAESDSDLAWQVNNQAVQAMAQACAQIGSALAQVSTDFVFSGGQSRPYAEDDPTEPLSVYGRSKLRGELLAREACSQVLILRTSWLFGAYGSNFVKTMLRLMQERESLQVVDDQIGSPTWAGDLAWALMSLMDQRIFGVLHMANEGVASWYDLALCVLEEAGDAGWSLQTQRVEPIPTTAYPTPAARPRFSVLSKQKIRPLLPEPIAHWRPRVRRVVKECRA